jgi:hypothetical protein
MNRLASATALATLLLVAPPASGRVRPLPVAVGFGMVEGVASVAPFEVDDPDLGIDLTVEPVLTFSSGAFTLGALAVGGAGGVIDGPASVSQQVLVGDLEIVVEDTIQIGPVMLPVSANISGPLTLAQRAPSVGSLVNMTTYVESSPGTFEITVGPLACSDNAFGLVCGAVETALGLEFPLTQVSGEIPIPFAFTEFAGLDTPGGAAVGAELEFALPLGTDGATVVDVSASFAWAESSRVVVPEPSVVVLLGGALAGLALARRRR